MITRLKQVLPAACLLAATTGPGISHAEGEAQRELLWGDTHLHTSYSFDAFLNSNQSADPDTAYRYARGLPVIHPYNRTRVRINTPLDFLVVADHAEFYGGIRDIYLNGINTDDAGPIDSLLMWYAGWRIRDAIDSGNGPSYFADLLPDAEDPITAAAKWTDNLGDAAIPGAAASARNAWARMRASAEQHNTPGTFTTLIGWEWSSIPGGGNLHRVVFTDASADTAGSFMPFGSDQSPYPEDLWAWLDTTSKATGARFLAIPHNSNISKGQMFSELTLHGEPIGADYAKLRRRWEPVVEITQIKGDSETHPDLSPEDPFADFELYPWYIQKVRTADYLAGPGDYVRSALKTGLMLEQKIGENPYRFGVIGSTDSHSGLPSAEEPNFWGKMAYDSIPENKQGHTIAGGPTGWTMQAAGLAAVWADGNNRSAIMDAFERREVYGTTGPRIKLRVFAGYDFSTADLQAEDMVARGYARGVPMGGELGPDSQGRSPTLLVTAMRDPASASLDRVQVVKGWVDNAGATHELVHDLVWSGQRTRGANGQVPAVKDTVNRAAATWDDSVGAAELAAAWTDPDFDANQSAFYYVRVLEIPTPRHALMDAIALGLEEPTEGPSVIQERAYSSAIHYRP